MVQNYIDKIIMSNDNGKMKELENILVDTIDYIQRTDKNIYCKIEDDLYEIAEGKVLTEEKATAWVSQMRPKAKWNISDIQQIKAKYKTSIPVTSLYVIMNMLYSDFGDVLGEEENDDMLEKYITMAEDWYYDDDIKNKEEQKLYSYWKFIVN